MESCDKSRLARAINFGLRISQCAVLFSSSRISRSWTVEDDSLLLNSFRLTLTLSLSFSLSLFLACFRCLFLSYDAWEPLVFELVARVSNSEYANTTHARSIRTETRRRRRRRRRREGRRSSTEVTTMFLSLSPLCSFYGHACWAFNLIFIDCSTPKQTLYS